MNGLIKKILLIAKNVAVILTLVTVLSTCSDDVDYLLEPMSVGYANLYTKNGSFENDIPNTLREDDSISVYLQSRALLASDIGVKVFFKFKRFDGQRTFTFDAGDAVFKDLGVGETEVKSANLNIEMLSGNRIKGSFRMVSDRTGKEFESWGDFEADIQIEVESFQDQDGNSFSAVKIENQWWMSSNLKATHFRNGDPVNQVLFTDTAWSNMQGPAYWELSSNNMVFYNFDVVTDERKIAPEGWHIPSTEEFEIMELNLGALQAEVDQYDGWIGVDSKIAEKIAGISYDLFSNDIDIPNQPVLGTKEFGVLSELGVYDDEGANLWTSTELDSNLAVYRFIDANLSAAVWKGPVNKRSGLNIRCIKD